MTLRIGHRGAAGSAPENTLAAFRRAVELGVDGVEFDVHPTADGHLVVIHDPTLDRTTSGSGLVCRTPLNVVRSLDAGSWYRPQWAGERVPTLAEVVAAVPEPCRLFVELKAGSVRYPGVEERLVAELRRLGALPRAHVLSFDHHALRRIRALAPDLPTGMLYMGHPIDPVAMARGCGATALHPAWHYLTPEAVALAHASGLAVYAWTVNEPDEIALVRGCGVDGIVSDFPERLPPGPHHQSAR